MMSNENKTNLIIAVRGYKSVKRQRNAKYTDVTAVDSLSKKILLRIIEPIGDEYTDLNDVKSMTEFVKSEEYDSAIMLSKKFTSTAVGELVKQNIQYVSDDIMLPFNIKELYTAITDCVNSQCMKKCGKIAADKSECAGNVSDFCKMILLAGSAKSHFEQGTVGLLKNDLKMALALNKQFLQYNPVENLPSQIMQNI
jgi:hypothetical protein